MTISTSTDLKALGVRAVEMMADGDLAAFEVVVHPEARNLEDINEPPASRGRGPAAFYATALYLREIFADLRWDVHQVVLDEDIITVHTTMSGRQIGTFVSYGPDARPEQAFPSRGRTFATTPSHWLRVADGMIVEHWANRDDLGTSKQLGWVPPSPWYLLRMMLATRKARRASTRDRR